jgi:glyoxylase-like metal-dependent hydrolase (beta-lactamase superfamily II)
MQLGDYGVEIIPDTEFRLDGGAMFGVVPRVVWERVSPPDEKNRIRMNMNCVFIDTGKDKILIETGIGEKWSAKQIEMYGIFRDKPLAETLFERAGCRPDDITIVVNTHLHFDHAGGNTIGADAAPQFANARYLVSSHELEHANNPHERDRASYLSENWEPMRVSGQLDAMPDDYEVVSGLKMQTIRGHSETMQTWRLDRGGHTMYGFADLIPTRHHVPLPWIMGYDLYPTETLAFKKEILPKAVEEGWLCLFYHDFDRPICKLSVVDGKIVASDSHH